MLPTAPLLRHMVSLEVLAGRRHHCLPVLRHGWVRLQSPQQLDMSPCGQFRSWQRTAGVKAVFLRLQMQLLTLHVERLELMQ